MLDPVRHGRSEQLCRAGNRREAYHFQGRPAYQGGNRRRGQSRSRNCNFGRLVGSHWISTHARVVDRIGRDEEGKPVEVLFGALAMQEWGIRLVPEEEKLDLTHYPKEFVEFTGP
ncbi:MAG: hypothetical protein HYU36_06465 [Planctomycetes bacterium]|nr:hypothetical protein [Planctomycetota bacterium]